MKKFYQKILFLPILSLWTANFCLAAEPMRTQDSIGVKNGKVRETGILGDPEGLIFLEFTEGTRVMYEKDHTKYEGEILPPEQIPKPGRPPKHRMRNLMSFELITDTADDVKFIDKFDVMSDKAKLRFQILHPEEYERTGLVKVFVTIEKSRTITDENLDFEQTIATSDNLALWEYTGRDEETEEEQWVRMGGKVEEVNDTNENIKIFMSTIRGTGIFTIFDENPPPSYVPPFPLDQIEEAGESPYPSVNNREISTGTGQTPASRNIGAIDGPAPSGEENILNQEDPETDNRTIPSIEGPSEEPSATENQTDLLGPANQNQTAGEENDPLSTDTQINEADPSPIAPDGTLPASGQEEGQKISLLFPLVLLGILGFIATGIFLAVRQKPY